MRSLDLAPFPFTVELVVSEAEWNALCEERGQVNRDWLPPKTIADVVNSVAGNRALVRVELDVKTSTLVHEAVHVVQALCQYINEGRPGAEFEAYYTDYIFSWLETECKKARKERRQRKMHPGNDVEPASTC